MLYFFQFGFWLDLLLLFNWLVSRYYLCHLKTLRADSYFWYLFDLVPCCCCASTSTTTTTTSAASSASSTSITSSSASCPASRSLYLLHWLDLFALSLLAWSCALCRSRLSRRCFLYHDLLNRYLVGQILLWSRQGLLTIWWTALLLVCLQPPSEGNKFLNVLCLLNTVQFLKAVLNLREEGVISWLMRYLLDDTFLVR